MAVHAVPDKEEQPQTTLVAKMAKVAALIERIEKRGYNSEQKYKFATAGDVFEEIRGHLGEQGVIVTPYLPKDKIDESEYISRNQAKGMLVKIYPTYTFRDGLSGETLAIEWYATAIDYPGDKAVYKALTNGLKYLLFQTFLVSTGDDVEETEHEEVTRPSGSSTPKREDIPPEKQAEFDRLNATLTKPWFERLIKAKMERFTIDQMIGQLREQHVQEHGKDDEHLKVELPA